MEIYRKGNNLTKVEGIAVLSALECLYKVSLQRLTQFVLGQDIESQVNSSVKLTRGTRKVNVYIKDLLLIEVVFDATLAQGASATLWAKSEEKSQELMSKMIRAASVSGKDEVAILHIQQGEEKFSARTDVMRFMRLFDEEIRAIRAMAFELKFKRVEPKVMRQAA